MSFAKSLFTVSSLTVLSRIGGFVRDTLTATFLGAGPIADAYFVAQRLPNLFRSLFAEGAFSAAFVPLFAAEEKKGGRDSALFFAAEALAMLLLFLIPFTIVMIVFMPLVLRVLAPGFHDDPEKFEIAVTFSRITFPYLMLISITALQGGVLNALGRFGPAAAAPIGFNLILIAALLLTRIFQLDVGYTLSWGMAFAGVCQMLWLLYSCRTAGVSIRLILPRLTDRTRHLFRQIGPGAIGAGATQINLLLSTVLASLLPTGSISFLFYADRLNQLPLGIVGIAVATTLLPLLARHVVAGEEDKVRHFTSRAIEFSLLLGFPAAIGLMLAARPIIETLFEHGAFTHSDAIETANALMVYSLSTPAFLLVKVFSSSFFARQDTKTPVKFGIIAMLVNVASALVLIGPFAHVGIALATSIATTANATLLFLELRKRGQFLCDEKFFYRLPRLILSAAGMAIATWLATCGFDAWFASGSLMYKCAGLVFIIGTSGIVYALLLQITDAMRWRDFLKTLNKSS